MARVYPVASGVLKHQIYVGNIGQPTASHANESVLTVWTYKAGSPVSATRVNAEQAALFAWFTSDLRTLLAQPARGVLRLRTWDYGLAPAVKWPYPTFAAIAGTNSQVQTSLAGGQPFSVQSIIVALRVLPVGSTLRSKLNGRLAFPSTGIDVGGNPAPGFGLIVTAFTNLRGSVLNGAGNVGTWSVVSFRTANAIRATPLVTPVDHVIVQRVGTQRRRAPKQGRYALGA